MQSTHFLIPKKRGEFKRITSEEFHAAKFLSYGIYRARIFHNEHSRKVFKTNVHDYYTQYDIYLAKKLGMEIELIEDGRPNALTYSREKLVTGNILFKDYVSLLFDLKAKGFEGAKPILNILWGALCEKNTVDLKYNKKTKELLDVGDDKELLLIRPINDDKVLTKVVYQTKPYKYNFARLAPFFCPKLGLLFLTSCNHIMNQL